MSKQVTYHAEDNVLTIYVSGRVDSANSAEIEAEVKAARAAVPNVPIVIDAEKLEYISSAGLRILLRLRKAEPELSVINVSSEVYDVLEMTGFTDILEIE